MCIIALQGMLFVTHCMLLWHTLQNAIPEFHISSYLDVLINYQSMSSSTAVC